MDYRTATKQQLLTERVRVTTALRKAEQRQSTRGHATVNPIGQRGRRGGSPVPQNEIDQLMKQLEQVEAELKRRVETEEGVSDQ